MVIDPTGHFVTVGAQLVIVYMFVVYTVEVVYPAEIVVFTMTDGDIVLETVPTEELTGTIALTASVTGIHPLGASVKTNWRIEPNKQ